VGIGLLHNTDTIGPCPRVSDNTVLCNAGAMPADELYKVVINLFTKKVLTEKQIFV